MENRKKDIFDKIMELPILNIFNPFFQKHREVLMFIFFGCVTTAVNFICYIILNYGLHINELVSNAIAWIISVLEAFITYRTFVFESNNEKIFYEFIKFSLGRVFSLIVEEIIIFIFVTKLGVESMIIKVISAIVIAFLNYFIGKLIVFKG